MGLLQRKIVFRQPTGELTEPRLDEVRTWLRNGGYSIPSSEPGVQSMFNDSVRLEYRWAYGQKDFVSDLEGLKRHDTHRKWLTEARQNYQMEGNLLPLSFHEENPFAHYKFFDENMIWRFTSRPSEESVYIAESTSYEEIIRVIAAHSGGNDKSNPNVKTLSFARNLGAIIGTAASSGEDKHVTNIVDKAEYLFGIDIRTLKFRDITAHPAAGRMISLFETEYVLVRTPGLPPLSLDALATVKYRNPFKGRAWSLAEEVNKGRQIPSRPLIEEKMGTVAPQQIRTEDMDPQLRDAIIDYSKKVTQSANLRFGSVIDKEPILSPSLQQVVKTISGYSGELPR